MDNEHNDSNAVHGGGEQVASRANLNTSQEWDGWQYKGLGAARFDSGAQGGNKAAEASRPPQKKPKLTLNQRGGEAILKSNPSASLACLRAALWQRD